MTKEEIIKQIEEIAHQPGFVYTLAIVLRHELFLDPAEAADINWRDHLSFQELTFLTGLIVKNKVDVSVLPTEDVTEDQMKKIYDLFQKLQLAHNQPFIDKFKAASSQQVSEKDAGQAYKDFFGGADMMAEAIFYGGSGAYDFQYLEFAAVKYTEDEKWLLSNTGVTISQMAEIARRLKQLVMEVNHSLPKPQSFEDLCKSSLAVFCFRRKDLINFSDNIFRDFIKAFSLTPGTVNTNLDSLGAYNTLDSHPIVRLEHDLFFVPIGFNLTKSIYESPFYWMENDKSYKDQAAKHRGVATEDFALGMLEKVFGKGKVYKNIKVQKNKKDITEIDVLAIGGNKAVIIQAKSKKLTELSKKGDDVKIVEDFEEAVQKAYDQGLASRLALLDQTSVLVQSDGAQLHLKEPLDDAYIICLTSDHYPAVTHQTDVYLKKQAEDPYPLPMSVFDLDMVTFYLSDPFEFLYYLRQRVNTSDHFKASSEAVLLGTHMKKKLYPLPEADQEILAEEFAQLIDANFPVLRGDHPKTKATERLYHKWKNEKFNQLIDQIKSSNDSGFTDAIFYLYDLAGEGADDLIRMMDKVKQKTRQDKQPHDFAMLYHKGKSGVTFVSVPNAPEKLQDYLMAVAVSRKYKSKADIWLALGSVANSPNIVDVMAFNKDPWEQNQKLEEMSKTLLTGGIELNSKGKKIGRNEKCPCESGKKWKKCHGK